MARPKRSNKKSYAEDEDSEDQQFDYEEEEEEPKPKKAKKTETKSAESKPTGKWKVGDEIPSLVLSNERGEEVNLLDEAKESGLVIFFYPKANTPGCTKQACEFRDKTDDFTEKGYKIFGCSADSQKSLTNWKTKYDFKYDLLSDPQFELIGPLGIKKAPKSVIRSHVVIGKGGVIEDLKIQISPLESPKQALEFISK